jgi:hypothetical protein
VVEGLQRTVNTFQVQECTLGDFSDDAMEDYCPKSTVAAIINAGGTPSDIDLDLGNVTMQQPMDCFPFGNTLVELEFTGADLWFRRYCMEAENQDQSKCYKFLEVFVHIQSQQIDIKGQLVDPAKIITLGYLASGGEISLRWIWWKLGELKSPVNYDLQGRITTTYTTTLAETLLEQFLSTTPNCNFKILYFGC